MNRSQKIKTAMVGCALILAAAVVLAVSGVFNAAGLTYENADKYTAGEAVISDPVKSLDVEWVNGSVTIETHEQNTVTIRETANRSLDDGTKLRWWMDGDVLRIHYTKSGLNINLNLEKKLILTLPEGTVLEKASINATSGDLIIPALKAEKLELGTTSGNITAEAEAAEVVSETTSGNQHVKLSGETAELRAGSTSGSIELEAGTVGKAKAATTSGGVRLTAENAGEAKLGSTSGNLYASLGTVKELTAGSTSGSINVSLPEALGFTVRVSTTSGDFEYGMPLTRNGDDYVHGDGSAKVNLSATSGDVRIDERKTEEE